MARTGVFLCKKAAYALAAVLRLQGVWRLEGRSTLRRREYGADESVATDQLGSVSRNLLRQGFAASVLQAASSALARSRFTRPEAHTACRAGWGRPKASLLIRTNG